MERERELISYDDICDNVVAEAPNPPSVSASDISSRYIILVKVNFINSPTFTNCRRLTPDLAQRVALRSLHEFNFRLCFEYLSGSIITKFISLEPLSAGTDHLVMLSYPCKPGIKYWFSYQYLILDIFFCRIHEKLHASLSDPKQLDYWRKCGRKEGKRI